MNNVMLTMVPDQRNVSLHDDSVPYVCSPESTVSSSEELRHLLASIPLPEITHHASRITPFDNENVS
jgi:hypothetical protein